MGPSIPTIQCITCVPEYVVDSSDAVGLSGCMTTVPV
jgi:hypothetical protein